MCSDTRPLVGFLAASLLFHAALLGWLHPTLRGAASGVADVAHLDISLLPTPSHRRERAQAPAATDMRARKPSHPPTAHRTPAPRKPSPRKRVATPVRSQPSTRRAKPPAKRRAATVQGTAAGSPAVDPGTEHPTKANTPTEGASAQPSSHHNEARRGTLTQRLRKALVAGLQRYFRYPPLARERGWEGKVVLALRIDGSGKISGLKVARSSGYPVLDRAALHSLAQVRRLPQAPAWLHGRDVEMELPVRYQLVGS